MPDWSETPPDAEDYVALRAACGLSARSLAAARTALPASLHAVTCREGVRLLGIGCVVGDGGCFVQLVDIAVHPDAQGRGVGRAITRRLVAWCEARLHPTCHIALVSSTRAVPLYAAEGFAACRGMDRYADPGRPSGMRG
ncbi:GNAT family N-acetyltransferase [uncultured Jannaschia sp.]|uniref:GNAT family N-acetyltransferase n=1 Tax=uncultured Jannaschia sp. TaxID=293347 RepID=UPI002608A327|nr:GNAT family N-acetyltransferase [uncultured Jannaschia sp.]